MEEELTPCKNARLANKENLDQGILGPWNEELQRSYEILMILMSTLAPEQRGDLIELLKIIVEECIPRKSTFEAIQHELEYRTSDTRQSERR